MGLERPVERPSHFHAVRFYKDDDSLCRIVGSFLAEGLSNADPAVVIATSEHTAAIAVCLGTFHLDVDELKRRGDLVVLDARDTLATFMADGAPDRNAFRRHVGGVFNEITHGRARCSVRAYGEMVDLLWKDGMTGAAIQVESLWNQLAHTHEFKLLCGYSMGNFYKGPAFDDIKDQHSHVTSDNGEHVPLH